MNKEWFHNEAHDLGRSLSVVRVVVAIILIGHPAYALFHPANIRGFGEILASHHVPFGAGVAPAVIWTQLACSLALLAGRLIIPAGILNIFVLVAGIFLVHWPKWRTVGLPDGDHQPGSEFSVLLIVCLLTILWAHRCKPAEELQAFEFLRIATASILIIHPIGGLRDPAGLNDLGLYFSSIGFPFGVQLVWGSMLLQIASSLALLARRFVVPACLGHMLVLITGICLFHAPHWFVVGPDNVVGPGQEGAEYSTLLITCFVGILIAYWPKRIPSLDPAAGGSAH